MKTALITGITGQDGSYLAELLLEKGYMVHGIKRRASSINTDRVDHLYQEPHDTDVRFKMHYGDMTDSTNLIRIIQETQPDEIYNLAAMSHVKVSFETPEYTANADGVGTLRLLEAIRILGLEKKTRIYQASTSELFGGLSENKNQRGVYDETSPFYPRSPYGVAKVFAYWITKNYREAYGMYACNGILFNHESPRRGETFVTRKITRAVAAIALGKQDCLYLGNLNASRDWGHAKDYVRAMWLMLQQDEPDDYVIATGKTTTVREFVRMAFAEVGITVRFEGEGIDEVGVIERIDEEKLARMTQPATRNPETRNPETRNSQPKSTQHAIGQPVIRIDPAYFRPTEVDLLIGDPSKAKKNLEWEPEYDLVALVKDMLTSDVDMILQNFNPKREHLAG